LLCLPVIHIYGRLYKNNIPLLLLQPAQIVIKTRRGILCNFVLQYPKHYKVLVMISVGRPTLHTIVCISKTSGLDHTVFGDNQYMFSDFLFVLFGTELVQ